jgi:hypothetical protein
MIRRSLLRLSAFWLLRGLSVGQMSTLPAARAIDDFPGPPKNPPIFSQMTAIWQGALQYQDTTDLKGPVARVEREESQFTSPNPNLSLTSTFKFDDDNHLVTRIDQGPSWVSTTTDVWVNAKLQSQTVSHHANDGKRKDWSEWQRWSYDKDGRLSEFKAGSDKQVVINDCVNFKYDEKGRPLGYEEYAQTLTEISYTGNKIAMSRLRKYQRLKFYEQIQTLDGKGRVVDLKVSDMNTRQLKPRFHVAFKYDDKGRVVEQSTDPFKLGSGDDYFPLPGKVVVDFDDEKRSGEQKYYDPDGKLVLHTKFEFDRDGILTKLRILDDSGKERVGGETFVDPQYKSKTTPGDLEWEIIYDDRGNWTERRRWFTPADGSPRIMTKVIRQKITYR